jgi:UDP-glucose 4-epimerase
VERSLVTGGAGFLGSHLVDELIRIGDEVLVLDNLSTGHRRNLAGQEQEERLGLRVGDVTDPDVLSRLVEEFAPSRVFHLAAQADVRRAVADPSFDAAQNVIGTINVLEAVRSHGRCPVIFASTGGAIYGEGEGRDLPFVEDAALRPETPYGASKLAGEVYVGLYRRVHGVPGCAVRFGNIYGPRQDPHGEAGVVAIFCGRLVEGGLPLTVFGNGAQTRDYVFVADAAAALIAAAKQSAARGEELEGPFNVGTGIETSVLSLIDALGRATAQPIVPEHAPARLGEVQRVAIDPSAAERELRWRPTRTLVDGLAETWEAFSTASPGIGN